MHLLQQLLWWLLDISGSHCKTSSPMKTWLSVCHRILDLFSGLDRTHAGICFAAPPGKTSETSKLSIERHFSKVFFLAAILRLQRVWNFCAYRSHQNSPPLTPRSWHWCSGFSGCAVKRASWTHKRVVVVVVAPNHDGGWKPPPLPSPQGCANKCLQSQVSVGLKATRPSLSVLSPLVSSHSPPHETANHKMGTAFGDIHQYLDLRSYITVVSIFCLFVFFCGEKLPLLLCIRCIHR